MIFSKTCTSSLVTLGVRYGLSQESDVLAKSAFIDSPFSSSHGMKDFAELENQSATPSRKFLG